MLFPIRTKYKKNHLILPSNTMSKSTKLVNGHAGLVSLSSGYISPNIIETARRVMVRHFRSATKHSVGSTLKPRIKKKIKPWWLMIFPFHSLTAKPREVRMGKGKGSHCAWVYPMCPGKLLFEAKGLPEPLFKLMFSEVATKLPVKTRYISMTNY